jgi:MoaA/NifB/PqqE/SkfB family radical SAM enzyme
MSLVSYAAGYVLDFLRERVTAADFVGERINRVLLAPGFDEAGREAVRRLFPNAELSTFNLGTSLWAVRRLRPDVACIPMAGGATRDRLVAMLSGARHKLLIPSPDYVYRFSMRRGALRLCWAMVDRFLLAPFAPLWFVMVAAWMYATGFVGRSVSAERNIAWRPECLLLIRLMPTATLVRLLRRLRRRFPDARLAAVLASEEGRPEVSEVADEVVSPSSGGLLTTLSRVRRGGFDTVLLAGGADYGLGLSYLKAAALAWAVGAARHYQWELGEPLPGTPLRRAMWRALTAPRGDANATPGLLGRLALRRRYAREPARGPAIVQIGLTQACNYHCLFCPFHNPRADARHREADLPRMSFELFARLLGELKRLGTKAVDICGDGEPLVHPEALDMIALARDLGFEVTLATNAALLTEERARRLVDLGLRRMHVSFNAATDDVYQQLHPGAPPGARARIIERLRAMADYAQEEGFRPIEVEFSAVLNRLNMHQLPQMVEAAHEARAGWFMLILMGPAPGADELLPRPEDWVIIRSDMDRAATRARRYGIRTNLDAVRQGASAAGTASVYERVPCYIGHEYALITADGSVMFCCQCTRPLGNLHQDSFRQIWYSEAYRQAREQARELPTASRGLALPGCECFTACSHVVVNLDLYRKLFGERALRSVL